LNFHKAWIGLSALTGGIWAGWGLELPQAVKKTADDTIKIHRMVAKAFIF
jgi:hypothetical protein